MNPAGEFFGLLEALAMLSGTTLNPIVVGLYDEALRPHGYEQVNAALKKLAASTTKRTGMPAIADVLEALGVRAEKPSLSEQAELIACNIEHSFRHGYNFPERGREELSDLEWRIVERKGGWVKAVEEFEDSLNPTAYHAQLRDLAKAMSSDFAYKTALAAGEEREQLFESEAHFLRVMRDGA